MKRLILLLAIAAQTLACIGQSNHVQGDLIVMFDRGVTPTSFEAEFTSINGIDAQMQFEKIIATRFNTYLYKFDYLSVDEELVLERAQNAQGVRAAQFNHFIEDRATPNDPSYGLQWHHNDASDNDIDTPEAWDITTGGQTANGDDIVVCVIEGSGSDYGHPDLIDNHWTNTAEVDGNGIDDDGNGFIDDINGWNSGSGNDNIGAGSHGTRVSGMIGAKGNNSLGVSGVNWDVKIMQVDMAGINEANVLAAYEYPYAMREMYNNSNGAEGAFVVATNASWGIDNGDPASFPVWCAYYDDLGSIGILNCGATANNNVNVDVVGDMPTGCGSDYMVSVTATNSSDVRTFSGYGATTIDLAAPGEAVYLPTNTDTYTSTSGTSFASPCVAGAIALVYSGPCSNLADLALDNPQAAADAVRGYILNGVDAVAGLSGFTVTGGRLNVKNSLDLLIGDCGGLAPQVPGCTNGAACNFDAAATEDDGSCCFENCVSLNISGGSFPAESTIEVYNSTGTLVATGGAGDSILCLPDDCYTVTMLDGFGDGWDETTYTLTDTFGNILSTGSLETGVSGPGQDFFIGTPDCVGCQDINACNFSFTALIDDGSCCFSNCYTATAGGGTFDGEISWEITFVGGTFVVAEGVSGDTPVCLSDGCYEIHLFDSFGDGWNGATIALAPQFGGASFIFTLESGSTGTEVFSVGDFCQVGCTIPWACNYDAAADINDGSCTYPGCQDCDACNFDPNAGCTDNSQCIYENSCGVCANPDGSTVGFYGQWAPFTWTQAVGTGDGVIEISSSYMMIEGNNNDDDLVLTQASQVLSEDGDFSFSWEYYTVDGPSFDIGYYINGVRFDLTTTDGGIEQIGTISFSASAGDEIGFGIESTDGCCGEGYLFITDFTASGTSCVAGCSDPTACVFDETVLSDNSTCVYSGCTSVDAFNYDSNAGCDDGSCLFFNQCGGIVNAFGAPTAFAAYYDNSNWTISNGGGDGTVEIGVEKMTIVGNDDGQDNLLTQATITAEFTGTYTFQWDYSTNDSGANYDPAYYINGTRVDLIADFGVITGAGEITFVASAGDEIGFGIESTDGCCGEATLCISQFTYPDTFCYGGCTDANACNYDEDAGFDNGTCDFDSCAGCTDGFACNYTPGSTIDDGSCIPSGCLDTNAINFDANAGCDDSSCLYVNACGQIVSDANDIAGFNGAYSGINWTTDLGTGDGNVIVDFDQIWIEGGNNSVASTTYVYTTVATSGTIGFTWDYWTNDGPNWDIAFYVNGVRTDLTDDGGFDEQGGPVSISVNSGDEFGFGIESVDGSFGAGYLKITEFTYPGGLPCIAGCTYPDATNYDSMATIEDGSCTFEPSSGCPGDLTGDDVVNAADLLLFLATFGTSCL